MSPSAGWFKRTFTGPRPWESTEATPFREVSQLSRGEMRLAAEVSLAVMLARDVPSFARERAIFVLGAMANA